MRIFKLSSSKSGEPVVEAHSGDKILALGSRFSPRIEAERFVKAQEPNDAFVLWGMGSGYIAQALRQQYPKAFIYVHEPFQEIVSLLWPEEEGLHSWRARWQIQVLTGLSPRIPASFFLALHPKVLVLVHPQYQVMAPDLTKAFHDFWNKQLEQLFFDYRTQSILGRRWLYCLSRNLKHLIDTGKLTCLEPSEEVVICGAGPGLDPSVMRAIQHRAPVISTDTALSWCAENGVYGGRCGSIDAQAFSARHLAGFDGIIDEAYLDPCAHPAYFRRARHIELLESNHPLWLRFLIASGREPGVFLGGGNVGHHLAEHMVRKGTTTVHTGGMDFNYRSDKVYCNPSHLYHEFHQQSTRTRPALHGAISLWAVNGTIQADGTITTPILSSYRANLDTLMGECLAEESTGEGIRTFQVPRHSSCSDQNAIPDKTMVRKAALEISQELDAFMEGSIADVPLLPTHQWLLAFTLIAPGLASIQRKRVLYHLNPADTLREDIRNACEHLKDALSFILEDTSHA